jgi:hypothetical protein
MSQQGLTDRGIPADLWAAEQSELLLRRNPPSVIWRGGSAFLARIASLLPSSIFKGILKKMTKLDVVEEIIINSRRREANAFPRQRLGFTNAHKIVE